MLTELTLANFRVFQEKVTLRIRPITLLTGENATGKSTVMNFLQLLHESAWPMGEDPFLTPEETSVSAQPDPSTGNAPSSSRNPKFKIEAHNHNFHSPRALPSVEIQRNPAPGPKVLSHFKLMDEHNTKQIHQFTVGLTPTRLSNLTSLEQEIIGSFKQPLAAITRVRTENRASLPHLQMLHFAARNEPAHHRFFTNHLHAMTGMDDVRFNPDQRSMEVIGPGQNPETPLDLMASSLTNAVNITLHAATMAPLTTLAAEHPELHLDPQAQLELGTFFADLWKQKNVFSIIETQSDYLLIRLRRLVANGYLKPHDISIAFFSSGEDSNGPAIANIDVKEDGALTPGLPMDFFGINVVEALHMGTRT